MSLHLNRSPSRWMGSSPRQATPRRTTPCWVLMIFSMWGGAPALPTCPALRLATTSWAASKRYEAVGQMQRKHQSVCLKWYLGFTCWVCRGVNYISELLPFNFQNSMSFTQDSHPSLLLSDFICRLSSNLMLNVPVEQEIPWVFTIAAFAWTCGFTVHTWWYNHCFYQNIIL